MLFGLSVLLVMAFMSFIAPFLGLPSPMEQAPRNRLQSPSGEAFFGTDMYGRDLFSRVLHGGQVSLVVGLSVAALATAFGLAIGLVTGFMRRVDAVLMRFMDALMSIPSILLAIALVALWGSSVPNVILALHHSRNSACRASGTLGRSDAARPAICAGRDCCWHVDPAYSDPAYPAEHHPPADRAGNIYLRAGGDFRGLSQLCRGRYAARNP